MRLVTTVVFFLIFWAVLLFWAFSHGDFPPQGMGPTRDMGVPDVYGTCRGKRDEGKQMWWRGWGDPVPFYDALGVRYVCKDHPAGWWFEAVPERRAIP